MANQQATVFFSPPLNDGGSPIIDYTVTTIFNANTLPTGQTTVGLASPITINGLTNGQTYVFTVHARNSVGDGPESALSNAVTPATLPDIPTIGTATAGDVSAIVTYTPSVSNGGAAITGYTATSTPGGFTGSAVSGPITVTGLTNGTSYTFTVHATNAVGNSAESDPSNSTVWSGISVSFTANPQFEMCSSYITLECNPVGSIVGHTFLWQQISGASVGVITDANQPTAYFTMPINRDDKIFTLTVDQGTTVEQIKTLNVSSTPQDSILTPFSDVKGIVLIPAAATQLNVTYVQNPPLRTSGFGYNVNYSDPTAITWTLPTDTTNIVGTALEQNTTGTYVQVKYTPVASSDRNAPISSTADTYRFRIDFTPNRSVYTDSFRIAQTYMILGDDDATAGSSAGAAILPVTLLLTRSQRTQEETSTYPATSAGAFSTPVVTLLTKVTKNDPLDYETAISNRSYAKATFSSITTIPGHISVGG